MSAVEKLRQNLNRLSQDFGNLLVDAFHYLAQFAIGATIVWSAVFAFIGMTGKGHASIDDIQHNHTPTMGILMISGGIMLLALANLVIRYGSAKFPSAEPGVK